MSDNEQLSDKRVTLRLNQADMDLLEEAQALFEQYLRRKADVFAKHVRVTQRMVVMQAVEELRDRLKGLERKR